MILGPAVLQVVNDMTFMWRRQPRCGAVGDDGLLIKDWAEKDGVSKAVCLLLFQTLALGSPLGHSN